MPRQLPAIAFVLTLVAAACTNEAAPATVPAATTTTTTQPATTTTQPAATTTFTIPYAALDVAIEGDDSAGRAIQDLYVWFGDRTVPEPDVPRGLLDHLSGVYPSGSGSFTGELFSEEIGEMGTAGVAIVNNQDVMLLVDDAEAEDEPDTGWRLVGAWFAQYDAGPWFGDPLRYVFVMGTDARPGQYEPHLRGDSLHILSSNIAQRAGGILGFPRDTLVQAQYSADKFTNVNANMYTIVCGQVRPADCDTPNAGQDEMVEIAARMSGLPLEGWIVTGFLGFQRLVDAFGGVDVDVPFSMAEPKSEAYLSAGLQTLFGFDALAFARNRTIDGGDFTRSFHHGLVILGALDGVLERDITVLPSLLSILMEFTSTSLSLEDLLTVAAGGFLLDPLLVGNDVLPAVGDNSRGYYAAILTEGAEAMFRDLDDGWLSQREDDD